MIVLLVDSVVHGTVQITWNEMLGLHTIRACNICYQIEKSLFMLIVRADLLFLVILSKQLFKLFMRCKLQRSIRNDPCHYCTVSAEETKETIF